MFISGEYNISSTSIQPNIFTEVIEMKAQVALAWTTFKRPALALLVVALLFSPFYFATAQADPLRIMAVGDSITAGYTDNRDGWTDPFGFGFRSGLYTLLTNADYNFQFVGESPEPWSGTTSPLPPEVQEPDLRPLGQDHHRGYGGAGVSTIANNIGGWITADDPDVILLMIGINSIPQYSTGHPTAVENTLNNLVQTVVTTKPEAHLIVAQITPYAHYTDAIEQYNSYIANTLVPNYAAQGKNVTTVDQYQNLLTSGVIDPNKFSNGINHPNTPTYADMAQTWFEGIEALDLDQDPLPNGGGENLVTNGGFETPAYSDPHHDYASGIAGSSWTPTGRAGIDRGNPYGGFVYNSIPFEGAQMGFLQGDLDNTYTPAPDGVTSLSQTISGLVPGQTYTLSFQAQAMDGYSGGNPFHVSFGGTNVTFEGSDLISPQTAYRLFVSDPITATAETMNLKFYDEGYIVGQKVSWIDDVQLLEGTPYFEENLVLNGSFETPVLIDPSHNYQTISGTLWTHAGRSGVGRGNIFGASAPNCAPAVGSQMAFLQGDTDNTATPSPDGVSRLSQDVTGFEIGEEYVLSFQTMGIDGYGGPDPFYVSLDGTDLFGLITPTLEYVEYTSDPFTATAEIMNLMFYDQAYTDKTKVSWIDAVSIIKYVPVVQIPGDANGDGVVNGDDAALLAQNWLSGPNATWQMGDFNDDGYVNEIDASMLAANWQSGTSSQSAPEPSAIVFLGGLLAVGLTAHRRR